MFNALFEEIEKWMRQLLSGMVTSNLTNMWLETTLQFHRCQSEDRRDRKSGWADPPGLERQYLFHDTQPLQFRHHPHRGHDHHLHTVL